MSPLHANAPLAKGRRGILTGEAEDKSGYSFAQVRHQPCTHPVTRTERFPGGQPHYAHEVCATCGRHLRWHPKPRNVERRKLIAAYVARLLTVKGLTSWEATFLRSVSKRRRLSPKREAIVGRLAAQHLETPTP